MGSILAAIHLFKVCLAPRCCKYYLDQQLSHHGYARHKAAAVLIHAVEMRTDNGRVKNSPPDILQAVVCHAASVSLLLNSTMGWGSICTWGIGVCSPRHTQCGWLPLLAPVSRTSSLKMHGHCGQSRGFVQMPKRCLNLHSCCPCLLIHKQTCRAPQLLISYQSNEVHNIAFPA